MRHRRNRKPLGTMTLILTAGIFLIMLTVMTLQGFLMYLYWKIFYQADIPIPQFWRPIPLLAVLSAVVGAGLTLLLSRIPLKPIRDLIEAINQLADGNFIKAVRRVGEEYPEIEIQERLVDAMSAKMLDPEFNKGIEVIVLPNLYGDIVTDVAAEHQGGLGTASSSNLGNKYAMFEAIHGTAPFLIDHNRGDYADPCSLIRAVGMLMAHIGYADRKQILDQALDICTITERRLVVTTDRDGASAAEFTDYLLETIDGLKK